MKKFCIVLAIILFLALGLGASYVVGTKTNHSVYRQIKRSIVSHPEFIPTSNAVKIGAAGFETIVGDFYWLGAIQYIGDNAVSAEYKRYLGKMLGLITDLTPYFTYPTQI